MRFAVIADSHIRLTDDDIATYPANALIAARNRWVVQVCNRIGVDFVVHLGDVVHPLPSEPAHEAALHLATEVYAELEAPSYFVPGNHDIGDKPNALVAVPAVSANSYAPFVRFWGRPFRSFDHIDCHFVIVDTPVLNSGLPQELSQRWWLESDLENAQRSGKRIFLFTHYPPFVRAPDEGEHYDNLGEPGRSWLLQLIERHQIEAVFSGHVHNFLFNRYLDTDLYVLPAAGFVRPDYSELAAIAPERDGGRDDVAKLGFFLVDTDTAGHTVRPVRSNGAVIGDDPQPRNVAAAADPEWRCPVGVTLRHGWMTTVELPTAGLDEFRRKTIRNDYILLALWEARIRSVRVPLEDLRSIESRERLRALSAHGMRFTVRSAGVPDPATIDLINGSQAMLERWEIAVWPEQYRAVIAALEVESTVPVAATPIVTIGPPDGAHHFVAAGLPAEDDTGYDRVVAADASASINEIGFRVTAGDDLGAALAACRERTRVTGRSAIVNVALPTAGENERFTDDATIGALVAGGVAAARAFPDVAVFLDGFMDHDRSYYRHDGLIDRRFNPRSSFYELVAASRGD
jgi:Icc-related predicted phosphoesterase